MRIALPSRTVQRWAVGCISTSAPLPLPRPPSREKTSTWSSPASMNSSQAPDSPATSPRSISLQAPQGRDVNRPFTIIRPSGGVAYEQMFDQRATSVPAPADQAQSHDLSYDNVMAAPRGPDRDHMSLALDQIEARIERIEHEIVALAPLVHERARLLRARAAI